MTPGEVPTVWENACDCHTHVFEPDCIPSTAPAYPLPIAPYAAHRAILDRIGIARAVLVQPSAYGSDHSVLIHSLARSGNRLRGVGLLGRDASKADFDRLEQAGIRALRFVEMRVPGTQDRYPGNFGIEDFQALRGEMVRREWHAELWAPLDQAADICDAEAGQGVPIILDHLAGATAATLPSDASFVRLLRHVEQGNAWVKLVLCRTAQTLDEAMATLRLHQALLAANPLRLVWGTDYPFIRKADNAPDPARLLAIAAEWLDHHGRTVLVDNPATLYRFN